MKQINLYITESLNKETYYVIKVISGKWKDSYVYADAEYWKDTQDINHASKGKSLNDIKKEKSAFEKETKNNFGEAVIIQVDVTYKEIK